MKTNEEKSIENYKTQIYNLVERINNQDILKRIYGLAQYLYIHKEK